MTDITELALITKIKKQLKNFDTVVLKEGEALALVEALEKALQRIAELESRTVTVKLPDNCEHDVIAPVSAFMYEAGFEIDTEDYNSLAGRVRSEIETVVRRTLRAAGIKWEAE